MRFLMKERLNEKGLTLVELLAVIVILAIIGAISVQAIGKIIENSRIKAAKSEAIIAIEAANIYFVEEHNPVGTSGPYDSKYQAVGLPTLIDKGYMSDNGYLNSTSYVTNSRPSKICAKSEGKSKVTFYNATIKQISDSKNELYAGDEKCGDTDATDPNKKPEK